MFKQKTAYEIKYGIVGSEMCIRDSVVHRPQVDVEPDVTAIAAPAQPLIAQAVALCQGCLLYTSDAADERSSVDLGGRRIIKKKTECTIIRIWADH